MAEMIDAFVYRKVDGGAEWPYVAFIGRFEEAIANCETKASDDRFAYRAAIRLCAAGRDLMIRYYNSWLTNTDVESDSNSVLDLFGKSLATFGTVSETLRNSDHSNHLGRMIENTTMRRDILQEIASTTLPYGDRMERAARKYESIDEETAKNFDIARF